MGFRCCTSVHEVRPPSCCGPDPSRLRMIYRFRLTCFRFVDPTIEHELASHTKPWALSPLISTMPYFAHRTIGESETPPKFPPRESLKDDNPHLAEAVEDRSQREKLSPQLAKIKTADQRRTYFANRDARRSITFGPNVGSAQRHVPHGQHNSRL